MNTKHSKKGHLEAAASHHEQAARYHHEASRHFEAGDHAHAAHKAMMAHGHALLAIDRAHDAGAHNGTTPPPITPASTGSGANSADAAKHHATAAELHEQAALHMRHAVKLFDQDRGAVAHDTQLALTHALRALSHSNEAARLFVRLASVEAS